MVKATGGCCYCAHFWSLDYFSTWLNVQVDEPMARFPCYSMLKLQHLVDTIFYTRSCRYQCRYQSLRSGFKVALRTLQSECSHFHPLILCMRLIWIWWHSFDLRCKTFLFICGPTIQFLIWVVHLLGWLVSLIWFVTYFSSRDFQGRVVVFFVAAEKF